MRPLVLVLLVAACRTAHDPSPPGLVDHHVHVLSPDMVREWKSIGVPFSRDDEHYTDVTALFEHANLSGAMLVPMAHYYGNAEFRGALELDLAEELTRVRAENDYVARLAARAPEHRAALASVDLLRPYALDELERARREFEIAGAKVHLASAGFDMRNEEHARALERVVAWTVRESALLLLHLDTQQDELSPDDVLKTLDIAFGSHHDARVIIAHLGGSGGFGSRARLMFDACATWLERERERGHPRAEFWFDTSAVPMLRESEGVPPTNEDQLRKIAPALRRVGVGRLLFGSDYPVFDPAEHARALADLLELTPEEVEKVFSSRVLEFKTR